MENPSYQESTNMPNIAGQENAQSQIQKIKEATNFSAKDFLISLFFGLGVMLVLGLLNLLFIAKANPDQNWLLIFLIFFAPLIIFAFFLFPLVYFFKKRRGIFWGLAAGLFIFVAILILVINFY